MKKTIINIFIITVMILSICKPYNADAATYAYIPDFNVTVNGINIQSQYRQFPLLRYKGIVYFPMTYYDCRNLGLYTQWHEDSSLLEIKKENITATYRDYKWDWQNESRQKVSMTTFNISVNDKNINNTNETYPLLSFRNVTYFPLTWAFCVDEFGWEYSYDDNTGLVINSINYHANPLNLIDSGGGMQTATDGTYYYYTGNNDKIYRAPINDTSSYQLIHTLESTIHTPVSFYEENGSIYMSYQTDYTKSYRYKINSDGSITPSSDGSFALSNTEESIYYTESSDIKITTVNKKADNSTYISYKFNNENKEISLDGICFAMKRTNGQVKLNLPQIADNNIYIIGYNKYDNENSALYKINPLNSEIVKVTDNVGTFFVFHGSDNNSLVVYDQNGKILLYNTNTLKTDIIDENCMPMQIATVIGTDLFVLTDDSTQTVVKGYDNLGLGSNKNELFHTSLPVNYSVVDNKLYIRTFDTKEIGDSVHLTVFDSMYNFFKTSDNAENIFINGNVLLYTVYDTHTAMVKVNLKN